MAPPCLRVMVLGAHGPSGRRTVQQALERGHTVEALTRHPDTFPLEHDPVPYMNPGAPP